MCRASPVLSCISITSCQAKATQCSGLVSSSQAGPKTQPSAPQGQLLSPCPWGPGAEDGTCPSHPGGIDRQGHLCLLKDALSLVTMAPSSRLASCLPLCGWGPGAGLLGAHWDERSLSFCGLAPGTGTGLAAKRARPVSRQ